MVATENLGPMLTTLAAVSIGVTTIAVLLRCYVRIVVQKRFSADDYLMLFSQTAFYALASSIITECKLGVGKHQDILMKDPVKFAEAMKFWWLSQLLFVISTYSVKVCGALFFYSLKPQRPLQIVTIGTGWVTVATAIGFVVFKMFRCHPVSYFWEQTVGTQGSCLSPYRCFIFMQVFNALDILTDVILALLPCVMVWNMNMRTAQKVGVSILLGLGILAAISSIVRAFYFYNLILTPTDYTYEAWSVIVTMIAEPAIAISVVCAAQLRPLLKMVLPSSWHSAPRKSSESHGIHLGRIVSRGKAATEVYESLEEPAKSNGSLKSGMGDEKPLVENTA